MAEKEGGLYQAEKALMVSLLEALAAKGSRGGKMKPEMLEGDWELVRARVLVQCVSACRFDHTHIRTLARRLERTKTTHTYIATDSIMHIYTFTHTGVHDPAALPLLSLLPGHRPRV